MKFLTSFLIIISPLLFFLSYSGHAQENKIVDKIIFNRYAEKYNMKPVVFTHGLHKNRYKCEECHDSIFIKKRGANDINMAKNSKGQYCGKCHNGKVAYPLLKCERCHSGKMTK